MNGQVVLITGAASGIGRATAQRFKQAGYTVYATARKQEAVQALRQQGFESVMLDVTDDASMQSAVDHIVQRHGAVDVLVNNAGYSLPGPVEELSLDDVRYVFETNVFGMMRMSQLVLPAMRRKGMGRIINVGSVGGLFTAAGSTAYHMTKHAVKSLSDGMRAEVAGFGVDVILIEPGGVATDFVYTANRHLQPDAPGSPYRAFKANIVKNSESMFEGNTARWGILKPDQVAATIVRAAQAERPRTRYKVGVLARVMPVMLGLMTDRQVDRMWLRQFPMTSTAEK